MARTAGFGTITVTGKIQFRSEDNYKNTLTIEANASQLHGNNYEKISKSIIW